MQLKNKLFSFVTIAQRHFLIPFCLAVFIILALESAFGFRVNPFGYLFVLYTGLIFGFIAFFLWFKKLDEKNGIRKLILEFLSPLFLMSLLIITISNLNFLTKINLDLIKNLNPILILISIFSGLTTFYANRERIEQEIDKEHGDESEMERRRFLEFPERFPVIDKIPFFNFVLKRMYKESWVYSFILIIILAIFIGLKVPFMNLSFTGAHNMKYSAYVEPAKHMLEKGLLWNQTMYQADPTTLPGGKFDTFGQYPFMEWGIVAVNRILPSHSLEFNTRVFMAVLGIVLLLSIYRFLKEFLVKRQILLILFVLSINVIFQFFTYVTVLDPINLIFLFLSLIFLIDGLKEAKTKKLFLSGILAGIGISVKYHALIFYFPIFILFLFFYNKLSNEKRISYLFVVLPNFLLQTIIFRISFRYLPRDFLLFSIVFILLVLVQTFLYRKINIISDSVEKVFKRKVKLFYSIVSLFSLIILYSAFSVNWIQKLFNDFITDQYLIFNWNMYNTLLGSYPEWLTPFVYYFSIFLLFLPFLIKNKNVRLLTFSFLISAFIYFVLSSKVLYFHEYYHHIIIFSFILFFSFIYYFTKLYKNTLSGILICLIFLSIIETVAYQNIKQVDTKLSIEKPEVKLVSDYLYNNIGEDQFFIYSANVYTAISFYSNRFSLVETLSNDYNKELVKNVMEDLHNGIPFGEVMEKHNIKIYVTKNNPEGKNNDFSYLFSTEKEIKNAQNLPERTSLILCKENNLCLGNNRFLPEIDSDDFVRNVKPHLLLLKKIDIYYIYQFI